MTRWLSDILGKERSSYSYKGNVNFLCSADDGREQSGSPLGGSPHSSAGAPILLMPSEGLSSSTKAGAAGILLSEGTPSSTKAGVTTVQKSENYMYLTWSKALPHYQHSRVKDI